MNKCLSFIFIILKISCKNNIQLTYESFDNILILGDSMKNKKGFTLVELLAVIAILAILVIMALPAVLKMYSQARKDSFTNEANVIIRTEGQKFLLGGGESQTFDNTTNPLPLSGNSDLEYCVSIDGNGKITNLQIYNGNYKYNSDGIVDQVSSNEVEDAELDYTFECVTGIKTIYSTSNIIFQIGSPIPEGATTYKSADDAMAAYHRAAFIKHIVEDNIIKESYLGFKPGATTYILKGADPNAYNDNKSELDRFFGSSNCTLYQEGQPGEYYYCTDDGLSSNVSLTGAIRYGRAGLQWGCYVDLDGTSRCNP